METGLDEDAWYALAHYDDDPEVPLKEEKEEPSHLKEMRRLEKSVLGAIASHRTAWEAEHPGQHFEAVRPLTRGRAQLSEDERRRLELERVDSKLKGKRWQERGPRDGDVAFWRGQALRTGACGGQRRFSNRGGKNRDHFWQKWQRSEGHIDG